MNIRLKWLIVIWLVWAGLASAQTVEIPDTNLENAIQEALQLPLDAPVTQQEMLRLTYLRSPYSEIADLTGLEYAINLKTLYLWGNEISDLTPLSNLTELRYLDMAGNQISDINPLANLIKLAVLNIGWNRVRDIAPLANLIELEHLNIGWNQVKDVTPLANLINLERLTLYSNPITDYSPLDGLSIATLERDEWCVLPLIAVHERIENQSFPSVVSAWAGIGWSSVVNRSELSDLEQLALHNLFFSSPRFGLDFIEHDEAWHLMGDIENAQARRDRFTELNPNMLFIVEIRIRDAFSDYFPADSPYWVRDASGNRVVAAQNIIDPNVFLMDFTHPDMQDRIVQQAIAVAQCGLYDGIFFDWWNEHGVVLADRRVGWTDGYRGNEAEQRARDSIIRRIRAAVRPEFLIMGNGNRRTFPRNAAYMNGSFMETLTDYEGGYTHDGLVEIESALLWLEQNLRSPQINCLEGWGISTESPDSPRNRRFMRVFTTMGLTHSDGYVLYTTGYKHDHYWYDFWDANLGKPVGNKAQTHGDVEGLFIREFTNGWAVYNRSGSLQTISLERLGSPVSERTGDIVSESHELPDLDGEIYLKIIVDRNGDGVVNILDLTLVANHFGTTFGDVNLDGTTNVLDLVVVAQQLKEDD